MKPGINDSFLGRKTKAPMKPKKTPQTIDATASAVVTDTPAPIDPTPVTGPVPVPQTAMFPAESPLRYIRLDRLEPNPFQPRQHFSEEELQELADSIRERGVLQPIVVRPKPGDLEFFQIIAGERRWRASRMAGVEVIPAMIRFATDQDMAELGVIENVTRSNMNPVETAMGYRRLNVEFGLKTEEIAKRVNKQRSTIANAMRILDLPPDVLDLVYKGQLSEAHGRALLQFKEWPELALTIAQGAIENGVSSKALEPGFKGFSYNTCSVLSQRGVVATLPWGWRQIPEFEECKKCPFNARRESESGYSQCLKPEHKKELEGNWKLRMEQEARPGTPENKEAREKREAEAAEREQKQNEEKKRRELHADRLLMTRADAQRRLDERRAYLKNNEGFVEGLRRECELVFMDRLTSWGYAKYIVAALKRWRVEIHFDQAKFLDGQTSKQERVHAIESLMTVDIFCLAVEIDICRDTESSWNKGEEAGRYLGINFGMVGLPQQ